MEPKSALSERSVIHGAIEELILRLNGAPRTPELRALLIEALRLRSVTATWWAVPPPPAASREMLVKIGELSALVPPPASGARRPGSRSPAPTLAYGSTPQPAPLFAVDVPRPSSDPAPRPPISVRVPLGPGIAFVRPDSIAWQTLRFMDGVSVKVLSRSEADRRYTALLRLAPNTELPPHRHAAAEELFVLDGVLLIGFAEVRAGDLSRAEPGSVHDAVRTETGCTLLINGAEHDRLRGEL